MTVYLEEDNQLLSESVVVGYGVQKKVNLTGAVAAVDQDQLQDRPVASVGQALQGVVPNLNITNTSGRPGASSNFNIRGNTSPNGGNPLILVDGVETDLGRINSNDIASISVLKDASSAAIYGARGAFGVILVTTKGGDFDKAPTIPEVKAVLMAWYPGQQGGTAISEIITGKVNPSGKLPISIEKNIEDNPTSAAFPIRLWPQLYFI